MADTKLTGLSAAGAIAGTDIMYVVLDPTGTPLSRKITFADMKSAAGLDPAHMSIYSETQDTTAISVAGTYVKVGMTTTVKADKTADLDDDTATSNRVKYLGASERHFSISGDATLAPDSGQNKIIALKLWHWDASAGSGSFVTGSRSQAVVDSGSAQSIPFGGDVLLDTNDYLELWVANSTDTNDVIFDHMYMFVQGLNIAI